MRYSSLIGGNVGSLSSQARVIPSVVRQRVCPSVGVCYAVFVSMVSALLCCCVLLWLCWDGGLYD